MNRILLLLGLNIGFTLFAFSQETTISVDIKNVASKKAEIIYLNDRLITNHLKKADAQIVLQKNRSTHFSLNILQPQFVQLLCDSSQREGSRSMEYTFFISPGDHLVFRADFKKIDFGFSVSGKGKENNQPMSNLLVQANVQKYFGDTLPDRVLPVVLAHEQQQNQILEKYIKAYKPTPAFVAASRDNVKYMAAHNYYSFAEGNKFRIRDAYTRNYASWQHITDSLFAHIKLSNDKALNSVIYRELIGAFLFREKERLWRNSLNHPDQFYHDWYETDKVNGAELFKDDPNNLLQEKIINKNFSGQAAEYLYAVLFDMATEDSDYKNLPFIFERFSKKYAHSKYISWFAPLIKEVLKNQQKKISQSVIFANHNGTQLESLQTVLNIVKGKTVLLDMWGTWCGPCRSETEKNGEAIKNHFKDKGLEYLYIANYDLKNEKSWKELIAYYGMAGTHILANERLTSDIMTVLKTNSYPTYVIIHKNGEIEVSKAGYPMDRQILINQLEHALKD